MTYEELDDIVVSLRMRCNFIETGDVTLSANDAIAQKKHKLVKALSPAQRNTIQRMSSLILKFLEKM